MKIENLSKVLFVVFLILLAARISIYSVPRKEYPRPSYVINVTEPRGILAKIEVKENKRKVAFDELHNSLHSIYSTYSQFASLFKSSNSEVIVLEEIELKDVDVLILLSPTSSYSKEEMNEILSAVKNGTTLIVLGEGVASEELNKITFNFGITLTDDLIYDLYNYLMLYKNPIIFEFSPSPLIQNVSEIVLYDACSLDIFGDAEAIAVTSAKSTLDKKGRLNVIAISRYGRGEVFVVCDSDIFSNEGIKNLDNEILAINLVNWS
jgi:hypothetical protein